eukprot:m.156957 g.156957  ORF g.156957 m.156957 type:complete len:265 (-) comp17956_c0_seq2:228-1022(-)
MDVHKMTRDELKAELTKNNVQFSTRAQLKTLLQLYEAEVLKNTSKEKKSTPPRVKNTQKDDGSQIPQWISDCTDEQLSARIVEAGLNNIPVNVNSRKLLEKRLARKLRELAAIDSAASNAVKSVEPAAAPTPVAPQSRKKSTSTHVRKRNVSRPSTAGNGVFSDNEDDTAPPPPVPITIEDSSVVVPSTEKPSQPQVPAKVDRTTKAVDSVASSAAATVTKDAPKNTDDGVLLCQLLLLLIVFVVIVMLVYDFSDSTSQPPFLT